MRSLSSYLTVMVLGAGIMGCGSTPSITPTLQITSPTSNSTVSAGTNKTVLVNFNSNWTLKAPGTCGGESNCGYVVLYVDSTNCDQPNLTYNALVVSSPADANLALCSMVTGTHVITLELHGDSGAIIKDLANNPVTAQVSVSVQ